MIKVDSIVKVTINDSMWIGQVVDIDGGLFLLRLLDNLHYWASEKEITLIEKRPISASK
jgi:hypothetical protein